MSSSASVNLAAPSPKTLKRKVIEPADDKHTTPKQEESKEEEEEEKGEQAYQL